MVLENGSGDRKGGGALEDQWDVLRNARLVGNPEKKRRIASNAYLGQLFIDSIEWQSRTEQAAKGHG